MSYHIRKVAVLGAGVMGAAIAAHLANVGIPSLLLDIVPSGEKKDRDVVARTGLEKTLKARPAAFYSKRAASLITIGNVEDDLEELADVDWIVEAVIERVDIKRALYSKIETVLTPGTIISSNTSGLPAHMLLEERSEDFRRNFLITHFFNPVRYMRLLEIVPTVETDPTLTQYMQQFATEVLGKGVVFCKDTPNFIANRIGTHGFMSTIQRGIAEGYTIGEVDTILGPTMGRPKSAIFRTADLSGLDTSLHVADNLYENVPNDPYREAFRAPEMLRELVKRKWLGEKSGQGFYKRVKGPDGKSSILELDLKTFEYVPQNKVRYTSIGAARNFGDPKKQILTVLSGDDRASVFARETTADSLLYAAELAEEIADSIVAIDEAMRWGFNFTFGSFEVWDLLLENPEVLEKVFQGRELPVLVHRVIDEGQGTFYIGGIGRRKYFDFVTGEYKPVPVPEDSISLQAFKANNKVVYDNGSAALIDLGDGVACLEFHTKMNAIDEGIIEMLHYAVGDGPQQFRALVIGNEADDFSAGANLF
ncbi:MAG TPA: 3-hydroxyacyl-CoA dehydrogenase NAD-binding domain-containing protein, partial [Ktedonobacteraceae bacterium]